MQLRHNFDTTSTNFDKLRHSRQGSALLIGMVFSILLLTLTISFADKVLRLSENGRGIENSTKAYYNATSLIETQLMNTVSLKKQPWTIAPKSIGSIAAGSGAILSVYSGSSLIPQEHQGNSIWDNDYNILSLSEPIQLVIPDQINWDNVNFNFRIPTFPGNNSDESISISSDINNNSGMILWTLASSSNILYASGAGTITKNDLDSAFGATPTSIQLTSKAGFYTDKDTGKKENKEFGDFYYSSDGLGLFGSDCTDYKCTLKLSLIRPIVLTDERVLPFLEYKIDFNDTIIPNQYIVLSAKGFSQGYLRERVVSIRQITTNTAFDFAVLQ